MKITKRKRVNIKTTGIHTRTPQRLGQTIITLPLQPIPAILSICLFPKNTIKPPP